MDKEVEAFYDSEEDVYWGPPTAKELLKRNVGVNKRMTIASSSSITLPEDDNYVGEDLDDLNKIISDVAQLSLKPAQSQNVESFINKVSQILDIQLTGVAESQANSFTTAMDSSENSQTKDNNSFLTARISDTETIDKGRKRRSTLSTVMSYNTALDSSKRDATIDKSKSDDFDSLEVSDVGETDLLDTTRTEEDRRRSTIMSYNTAFDVSKNEEAGFQDESRINIEDSSEESDSHEFNDRLGLLNESKNDRSGFLDESKHNISSFKNNRYLLNRSINNRSDLLDQYNKEKSCLLNQTKNDGLGVSVEFKNHHLLNQSRNQKSALLNQSVDDKSGNENTALLNQSRNDKSGSLNQSRSAKSGLVKQSRIDKSILLNESNNIKSCPSNESKNNGLCFFVSKDEMDLGSDTQSDESFANVLEDIIEKLNDDIEENINTLNYKSSAPEEYSHKNHSLRNENSFLKGKYDSNLSFKNFVKENVGSNNSLSFCKEDYIEEDDPNLSNEERCEEDNIEDNNPDLLNKERDLLYNSLSSHKEEKYEGNDPNLLIKGRDLLHNSLSSHKEDTFEDDPNFKIKGRDLLYNSLSSYKEDKFEDNPNSLKKISDSESFYDNSKRERSEIFVDSQNKNKIKEASFCEEYSFLKNKTTEYSRYTCTQEKYDDVSGIYDIDESKEESFINKTNELSRNIHRTDESAEEVISLSSDDSKNESLVEKDDSVAEFWNETREIEKGGKFIVAETPIKKEPVQITGDSIVEISSDSDEESLGTSIREERRGILKNDSRRFSGRVSKNLDESSRRSSYGKKRVGKKSSLEDEESPAMTKNKSFGILKNKSSGITANESFGVLQNESSGITANDSFETVQNKSSGITANDSFEILQNKSSGNTGNDSFGTLQNKSSGMIANESFEVTKNKSPGITTNESLELIGSKSPKFAKNGTLEISKNTPIGILKNKSPLISKNKSEILNNSPTPNKNKHLSETIDMSLMEFERMECLCKESPLQGKCDSPNKHSFDSRKTSLNSNSPFSERSDSKDESLGIIHLSMKNLDNTMFLNETRASTPNKTKNYSPRVNLKERMFAKRVRNLSNFIEENEEDYSEEVEYGRDCAGRFEDDIEDEVFERECSEGEDFNGAQNTNRICLNKNYSIDSLSSKDNIGASGSNENESLNHTFNKNKIAASGSNSIDGLNKYTALNEDYSIDSLNGTFNKNKNTAIDNLNGTYNKNKNSAIDKLNSTFNKNSALNDTYNKDKIGVNENLSIDSLSRTFNMDKIDVNEKCSVDSLSGTFHKDKYVACGSTANHILNGTFNKNKNAVSGNNSINNQDDTFNKNKFVLNENYSTDGSSGIFNKNKYGSNENSSIDGSSGTSNKNKYGSTEKPSIDGSSGTFNKNKYVVSGSSTNNSLDQCNYENVEHNESSDYEFNDTLEEMERALKYGLDYSMTNESDVKHDSPKQNNDFNSIGSHNNSMSDSESGNNPSDRKYGYNTTQSMKKVVSAKPISNLPVKSQSDRKPERPKCQSRLPVSKFNHIVSPISVYCNKPANSTEFKKPPIPAKASLITRFHKNQPAFSKILSPVSHYIKNTPTAPLQQNNDANKASNTHKKLFVSTKTTTKPTSSKENIPTLPPVVYKPASRAMLSRREEMKFPHKIEKLIPEKTDIVKHQGRLVKHTAEQAAIERKLLNNDLTISNDSMDSSGVLNSDVSILTSKKAFIK